MKKNKVQKGERDRMETIVCSKVCKQYGTKQVLKEIDLTLEKGKIYGLIGRNVPRYILKV